MPCALFLSSIVSFTKRKDSELSCLSCLLELQERQEEMRLEAIWSYGAILCLVLFKRSKEREETR